MFRGVVFAAFALWIFPLLSRADEVDDILKETVEYQGGLQKATEDHTEKVYKEKGKEIEAKRIADQKRKQSADGTIASQLEAEAKLDRVSHPENKFDGEVIQDEFIRYINVHFQKNTYRVKNADACTGDIGPADVPWVAEDQKAMKQEVSSAYARAAQVAAENKARIEATEEKKNRVQAEANLKNIHVTVYGDYSGMLDANAMKAGAKAMEDCSNDVSGRMERQALSALGVRKCKKSLDEMTDESPKGRDAVIRVISADYWLGRSSYPDEKAKACFEKYFKKTKFYEEFWGEIPPMEFGVLEKKMNEVREKKKSKGEWFSSKEMYLWANELSHSLKDGKKLTDDEKMRNSNVIRRMKTYDPLYPEYMKATQGEGK